MPSRAHTRVVSGYFQPTSATQSLSSQTAPVLTSLESDFGFAPVPSEVPVGSRRRARFDGTARILRRVLRSSTALRSSPLTSLSQPALVRSGLSAERDRITDRRGHFCLLRRDASPAFVPRDAFRWSPFERLPPCGVSLSFRIGPSRISVVSKVTPSRSARGSRFAFAGSRSSCDAPEVFPRG